ncbi:MAG TPA: M35 family metallo-endopeptidase [Myxococcaceae bacterium]|jgi:peptidyl-Lys metalloendopeptidase
MSKTPRHLRWLVGGVVGFSLLGACGAPEERQENAPEQSAPEARAGEVAVSLSVGASALSAKDELQVTVTLTNVSGHTVKLLKWHTPVEGLEEPLFAVTRDGVAVDYIGKHAKRAAPSEADYVKLAAGESLTRTVSLAGAYDLSVTGSYSVSYAGEEHEGATQFTSNSVTLWVEGRANVVESGDREVTASALSFTNCTSTQQSTITSAISAAKSMASNSLSYLTNTTPGNTSRYKTWFGTYSSTNWSTAKSHFNAINSAFNNQNVVVDCSCKQSYYAYVYPTQPYKIYVCNAFWSAPMTGTDSKGGTLVHEMSHFNVVAATDDHAYGQTAAKNLAVSSPTKALDNADNHEYFAENTPSLP